VNGVSRHCSCESLLSVREGKCKASFCAMICYFTVVFLLRLTSALSYMKINFIVWINNANNEVSETGREHSPLVHCGCHSSFTSTHVAQRQTKGTHLCRSTVRVRMKSLRCRLNRSLPGFSTGANAPLHTIYCTQQVVCLFE